MLQDDSRVKAKLIEEQLAPALARLAADPKRRLRLERRLLDKALRELEDAERDKAAAEDAIDEAALAYAACKTAGDCADLEWIDKALRDNKEAIARLTDRMRFLRKVADAHLAAIAGAEVVLRRN
jgi:hypothetical protein